jgi:hypothetical protein
MLSSFFTISGIPLFLHGDRLTRTLPGANAATFAVRRIGLEMIPLVHHALDRAVEGAKPAIRALVVIDNGTESPPTARVQTKKQLIRMGPPGLLLELKRPDHFLFSSDPSDRHRDELHGYCTPNIHEDESTVNQFMFVLPTGS